MKQLVRNLKIIGAGSYTLSRVYTNEYLEGFIETNSDWIIKNLGIRERRIADDNESTSYLASKVAVNAINNAGLTPADLDLIIVSTATPDRLAPSIACFLHEKIEAYNVVAFDLSAICSGFLYGMSVASQFIAAGVYVNLLVIRTDTFSCNNDWYRRDFVFFGDGAGAPVISNRSIHEGFLAFRLYTDIRVKCNFTIPAGRFEIRAIHENIYKCLHFFQMNGRGVYETGRNVLPLAINKVLVDTGLSIVDIDYVISHQSSIRIFQKTAEIKGSPFGKVITKMDKFANSSGGIIPKLLYEVNRVGKLKKGNILLFAVVGSGWICRASIYKWSLSKYTLKTHQI